MTQARTGEGLGASRRMALMQGKVFTFPTCTQGQVQQKAQMGGCFQIQISISDITMSLHRVPEFRAGKTFQLLP